MFGDNKNQKDNAQQAGAATPAPNVDSTPVITPSQSGLAMTQPSAPTSTTAPLLNESMAAPESMPIAMQPVPDDKSKETGNINQGSILTIEPPTETPASPLGQDSALQQPIPASANSDELLGIKQQALQKLAPLVDKLEQTPEDRFKTTMMLIQASDNPELVSKAFDAANSISDEKLRAQALLDVVNEINYFTQSNKQ